MYTDIHTLTDEILASVQDDVVKEASLSNVDSLRTNIGKQFQKVAAQLRETEASDITYADLLIPSVKTASVRIANEDTAPSRTELSRSLREVAATLRHAGLEKSAAKRENSARILRAALGLTTLTKDAW